MSALPAREGYRLWAPHYETETAVSHLEDLTVAELDIATTHRVVLDAGCGTARRLRESGASIAIGVDITPEMLMEPARRQDLVAADLAALPFGGDCFDVVWCRLVIGHVRDLDGAYAELSRVCRYGGAVVVSDFASEAIEAGHRRTFHDTDGTSHELEHHVHATPSHALAARRAGLRLIAAHDGIVGPSVRTFYSRANRLAAYDAELGLPIVRAFAWRRSAPTLA